MSASQNYFTKKIYLQFLGGAYSKKWIFSPFFLLFGKTEKRPLSLHFTILHAIDCVVGFVARAVFCKMLIYIKNLSYVFFFWRGRICLLIEIGGNNNFEENAFKLNLFLMILPFLVFLAIWHFRAKVFSIKKFKHCDSDSDILRRSSFWAVSVRWEGRAV